jgi:hypothetical protein
MWKPLCERLAFVVTALLLSLAAFVAGRAVSPVSLDDVQAFRVYARGTERLKVSTIEIGSSVQTLEAKTVPTLKVDFKIGSRRGTIWINDRLP